MKTRESGMPDAKTWASFFRPAETLRRLGLSESMQSVVEFGCGYGTFTVPAARIVQGVVYGLDIDDKMIAATRQSAVAAGCSNVVATLRDFVTDGAGLADQCADFAMLFNILHCEQPGELLAEAGRVLRVGGVLAIMHWNYDPSTPRGPSMAIRPRPEQCLQWANAAGFRTTTQVNLPPYHYGLTLTKAQCLGHKLNRTPPSRDFASATEFLMSMWWNELKKRDSSF